MRIRFHSALRHSSNFHVSPHFMWENVSTGDTRRDAALSDSGRGGDVTPLWRETANPLPSLSAPLDGRGVKAVNQLKAHSNLRGMISLNGVMVSRGIFEVKEKPTEARGKFFSVSTMHAFAKAVREVFFHRPGAAERGAASVEPPPALSSPLRDDPPDDGGEGPTDLPLLFSAFPFSVSSADRIAYQRRAWCMPL